MMFVKRLLSCSRFLQCSPASLQRYGSAEPQQFVRGLRGFKAADTKAGSGSCLEALAAQAENSSGFIRFECYTRSTAELLRSV